MKINLKFSAADFKDFNSFEKSVKKQLGKNVVYVGTDYLCIYIDYPKNLKNMLRPYPENEQLEFEIGE